MNIKANGKVDILTVAPSLRGTTFAKICCCFFLTKVKFIILSNIFHKMKKKMLKRARVIGKKRFFN